MELALYNSAVTALAECRSVDEVKSWSDRAAATQAYARMAKDKRLEVDAAEIRIRAERRLGEMLLDQKSAGLMSTGAMGKGSAVVGDDRTPTLAEVGVSKDLSARAQRIAKVPQPEFEAEIETWRDRVEAEGARVSARLEAKGAAVEAGADPEPDDTTLDDLQAELEALSRIIDADDKLAEAARLLKAERESHARTRALYDAQRLELASITKEAKRWMKRCQKFEKGELK